MTSMDPKILNSIKKSKENFKKQFAYLNPMVGIGLPSDDLNSKDIGIRVYLSQDSDANLYPDEFEGIKVHKIKSGKIVAASNLMTELKVMNGRYQFGWVIQIIEKDDQGFQIELADLGNGKRMIVATDLTNAVAKDTCRQAGFGPFTFEDGMVLDEQIKTLKEDLFKRRVK
jgi:hypothetical protein